ncbi:MAG TPA: DNA-binding protein YbiB [Usitatibacter sp.]|jgi:anthranilate phosphoribosyltransferase|nr:DNA-binding protein YbiB [Usitatibacter sp.]
MAFDARPYLKEIARGPHSARDLSRDQARALFAAIFAGEVADVALGAVLVALRMKGETVEELAGMMEALAGHLIPIRMPARRALPLVIPTYNGARKLPNLLPLLALKVAREGIPVLLHGAFHEPGRVTAFHVLERMGMPAARTIGEVERALEERHLAAAPLALVSPALARVLDARIRTGVRSAAHTLAKLLLPGGVAPDAGCRLIPVTHPDFVKLLRAYFAIAPGDALLMRGLEGEAVVRLHSPQPIEALGHGAEPIEHRIEGSDVEPELPDRDAEATAQWTRDVLDGKVAAPAALSAQAAFLVEHCRRGAGAGRPALRLVSSH